MIRPYKGVMPTIPATCYVDVSAQVIGDVVLGEHASIWMNAVAARRCALHPHRQQHQHPGQLRAARDAWQVAGGAGR